MDPISIITAAAKAVGIAPAFMLALCTTESNLHNLVHHNDGGSDSIGICQVKETTAQMFDKHATRTDLLDPSKNARFAALYLARQKRIYKTYECIATAYNRGSLDTKHPTCNTKYSNKVMKTLEEQSWKKAQRKAKQVQGRTQLQLIGKH